MWCICWPASGGRLFTSWEEFTGGLAPTSSDEHLVWVSQENRQHGARPHQPTRPQGTDRTDVYRRCQRGLGRRLGGCADGRLGPRSAKNRAGWSSCRTCRCPTLKTRLTSSWATQTLARWCWIWEGEQISSAEQGYYRWLNVGQKLPIVGGTDKMSNGRILGGSRTYVKLRDGEEFTFDNWCQAVRRGQDLCQHRRDD